MGTGGGLLEEVVAGFVAGLEKFLDTGTENGIVSALAVEVSGALGGRQTPNVAKHSYLAA